MYKNFKITDKVRVPPDNLGEEVESSIKKSLEQQLEGEIVKDLGVVLSVKGIDKIGGGSIEPEDPGVFYKVTYNALAYQPEVHEIVEGEIVDITEFGAFVRVGPIDGLCHVSQIMDDYVSFDEKQSRLVGKDSDRSLNTGDFVRARVISVSLAKKDENKVNLTMRQPALGLIEWVKEEEEEENEEE